jgi:hypothetical protein
LNVHSDKGLVETQSSHCTNHAFAAHSRGLDGLAVTHYGKQRKHAVVREIDLFDLAACFVDGNALRQHNGHEVGREHVKRAARQ